MKLLAPAAGPMDLSLRDVVGRNLRTTDSAPFTGTRVRILSTRAPIVAGRTYSVMAIGEVVSGNGLATSQHELRITTDDTEPLTTSLQIGRGLAEHTNTIGVPIAVAAGGFFHAAISGFLRAAVVSHRPIGSVNCRWTAAADRPMHLFVIDEGPTVPTSGTVY